MKKGLLMAILSLTSVLGICQVKNATTKSPAIKVGAERTQLYLPLLEGKSVGIFANPTSTVGTKHLVDTLISLGVKITVIFGPEHGFRGTADAGEKVGNAIDEKTGIPVVSLYGAKRRPSAEDLKDVDVMIYDIQDVGVRFYTFISSLEEYIRSAREFNKPLLLLDRPNPNGFYVDGPVLDPKYRSFVGMQPIPIVYGMTPGEYATMLLGENWIKNESKEIKEAAPAPMSTASVASVAEEVAEQKATTEKTANSCAGIEKIKELWDRKEFSLMVICCENYSHKSLYELPVKPSPNLPNAQSIYLYPSTCLFEGTSLSEGRGTDKPFQIFGAPTLPKTLKAFTPQPNEGAKSSKHYGKVCYGWDLSGTTTQVLGQIKGKLQLKWLIEAYRLFPQKDSFFLMPKSGNMEQSFITKLAGTNELWQQIKSGKSEAEIRKSWEPALSNFKAIRKRYLLYEDFE